MKEFFKKLTENIISHDNIVIMTHKCPDLDGMGSAIAFNEILKKLGKKSCIVAPKSICDKSLNKTIKYLNDKKYVIPFKYEKKINDKNTFLIIFDTGEDVLTESEDVLNKIKDRCVIDHHTILCNKIVNNVCEYIDETKSSTIEIVAEYLKYLDTKIDSDFYTIMFTGMYIDTNGFNLKTTPRTLYIASYLVSMGADIKLKQEFLKESIDDVLIRYEYVKKCVKLDNNIYLCVIDDRYSTKLDTALLADEMLKFEGFNVSIAIGKNSNDEVLISARSNGSIDVCKIMSKFGGGGHVGAAAATIKNSTIESVINKLKNVIKGE